MGWVFSLRELIMGWVFSLRLLWVVTGAAFLWSVFVAVAFYSQWISSVWTFVGLVCVCNAAVLIGALNWLAVLHFARWIKGGD